MSQYKDDDKKSGKNQSKGSMKEHHSTSGGLRINSLEKTLKGKETLYGSVWNNSIPSVLEEQKKMMQERFASTLNAFKDQGITMVSKTTTLKDLKVPVLNDPSLLIGIERIINQTATLVGESLLQHRMLAQDNLKISSGLSTLKETAMSSVASALKQQTNLIREDWSSTLGILGQPAIGLEKLNQSYLKTASERLQLDLHSPLGLNSISIASSVAIKGVYESAVNDIENIYRKVENNPDLDIELSDKEFIEEFIKYCKQVGSMLNTLNSSAIWDVLQKIVIIHGLYMIALSIAGGSETNHIDNPDIQPIEERNSSEEKHDYEIDVEKNIEDMDINAGTRT